MVEQIDLGSSKGLEHRDGRDNVGSVQSVYLEG